jgi:hypothetical protein
MTNDEIIIHQARKIAELESINVVLQKDSMKYADWWLASNQENKELKLQLHGGDADGGE